MEIELKLALPPGQVAGFMKRMARRRSVPVQQDLVTRYFDTPDFVLSGQGVALRVRRAGRRWLQTLKTEGERQGGLSRRVEFEMPVRRGAPDWNRFPPEAGAYVSEALRAQLVPVFETRFHRTAWRVAGKRGARIEVALDVGEVITLSGINAGERRQPLCEIELELKSGQPDALFALALEWAGAFDCLPFDISKAERGVRLAHGEEPAPLKSVPLVLDDGMSVEEGFAAICQACLAQFQVNLPGVLASDDIEYVHQARVALRRLRAALRLFRDVCVLPDDLLAGLDALAAALGPARDWDVLCGETLPAIAPRYPDADTWQRGMQALERRRLAVRTAMREGLNQAHPGAWLLAFQRWLLQHGWRSYPGGGGRTLQGGRRRRLSVSTSWRRWTHGHAGPCAQGIVPSFAAHAISADWHRRSAMPCASRSSASVMQPSSSRDCSTAGGRHVIWRCCVTPRTVWGRQTTRISHRASWSPRRRRRARWAPSLSAGWRQDRRRWPAAGAPGRCARS